jgi:hypothetical protein
MGIMRHKKVKRRAVTERIVRERIATDAERTVA